MLESWAVLVDPRAASIPPQTAADPGELIPDIIERFHDVHRRDFPEAIRLARRVEGIYAHDLGGAPFVADYLAMMFDELEAHQQREERVLFPAMRAGGCAAIRVPLRRMMAEHGDVERQLATLKDRLGGYVVPRGAAPSWSQLVALCRKIDADLREHMRIENEELFAPYLIDARNGEGRAA